MIAEKPPLVTHIEELEQALAADSEGQEQNWVAGLRDALRGVEHALGRHPAPSDKNVLSHLELQRREIHPGLTRESRALRENQQAMFEQIDVLATQLERDAVHAGDVPALREIGAKLVKDLQKFRATENRLIFDNVMRDTGAGD
jgi:phytoene dehydrogenase-like protein